MWLAKYVANRAVCMEPQLLLDGNLIYKHSFTSNALPSTFYKVAHILKVIIISIIIM